MGCIEGYGATAQYLSFLNHNGQSEPFMLNGSIDDKQIKVRFTEEFD